MNESKLNEFEFRELLIDIMRDINLSLEHLSIHVEKIGDRLAAVEGAVSVATYEDMEK